MVSLDGQFTIPELAAEVGNPALVRDIAKLNQRLDLPSKPAFKSVLRIARKVDKLGQLHQLQTLLVETQKRLENSGDTAKLLKLDTTEVVGRLVNDIATIQSAGDSLGFKAYDYYLRQYKSALSALFKGGELVDRMPSGWRTFDRATGGLPNGVTIIAGMPGSGKTQLALQLALNRARQLRDKQAKGIVAINSIEMSGVDLVARAILSEARLDSTVLRSGGYTQDKDARHRIVAAIEEQGGLPILIDDSDFLTSNIIAVRVSGLKARFQDVVLIVSDFLELIRDKGESAEQRVSNAILNAKSLGKRFSCPVVMISQISRQVELTGPRVPSIRHLRMSGMIEAIADLVLLNYYPFYYLENGIKITPHKDMPPIEGIVYEIIGKNRNGPVGFFRMGWQAKFTRWFDVAKKEKDEQKRPRQVR